MSATIETVKMNNSRFRHMSITTEVLPGLNGMSFQPQVSSGENTPLSSSVKNGVCIDEPAKSPPRRLWSRRRSTLRHQQSLNGGGLLPGIVPPANVHLIEGPSHYCFAKDLTWFQGSITPPHHCVYKVTGKQVQSKEIRKSCSSNRTSLSLSPSSSSPNHMTRLSPSDSDAGICIPPSSVNDSRRDSIEGLVESISASVKQLDTSENSSEKSEELDPIDVDLIRNTLEQISNKSSNSKSVNFEDEEEEDSFDAKKENTRVYNVIVSDFETGLTYNLDEVKVEFDKIPSASTCEVISNQLRFKSESKMKGMAADAFLAKHLGPSYIEMGLTVFKGITKFSYVDEIYKPVKVDESQWYL